MKVRVIAVITDLDIIQKIFSRARPIVRNNDHKISRNHQRCVLQFAFAVCICISQFAQSFVSAIADRQFLSPS